MFMELSWIEWALGNRLLTKVKRHYKPKTNSLIYAEEYIYFIDSWKTKLLIRTVSYCFKSREGKLVSESMKISVSQNNICLWAPEHSLCFSLGQSWFQISYSSIDNHINHHVIYINKNINYMMVLIFKGAKLFPFRLNFTHFFPSDLIF